MVNGLIMRSRGSSLMHLDNNSLKFKLRRRVTLMTLNVEGCWALDCTAQLSHRVAETGPPTKEQCSEQQFCDTCHR